jgi:hypothetical protein
MTLSIVAIAAPIVILAIVGLYALIEYRAIEREKANETAEASFFSGYRTSAVSYSKQTYHHE